MCQKKTDFYELMLTICCHANTLTNVINLILVHYVYYFGPSTKKMCIILGNMSI